MSNATLLAAKIASLVPAMAQDCAVNNETLLRGMIEEYLGKPESSAAYFQKPKTEDWTVR